MDKSETTESVEAIAKNYIPVEALNLAAPLTGKPYFIEARDLAAMFLDIERILGVDLNELFERRMDYSVNSIAEAICATLK